MAAQAALQMQHQAAAHNPWMHYAAPYLMHPYQGRPQPHPDAQYHHQWSYGMQSYMSSVQAGGPPPPHHYSDYAPPPQDSGKRSLDGRGHYPMPWGMQGTQFLPPDALFRV